VANWGWVLRRNSMEIKSLGHVVIRVRDLQQSEVFYRDTLGLPVCAHYHKDGVNMAFFTLGDHHDFAIIESPNLGEETRSGLDHVAFKIGDHIDDLKEAKTKMEALGIATDPIDHDVTKSLYIADPDGNGIELYIDHSDGWKQDPNRLVDTLEPLSL
jgi:catechol 2,3-dioxygenase